ncbi:MAG: hypothetical protein FJW63_03015 [Actinobacteria bacterium]|nr:hypothetical protein [Actinomycetota bacterium]
MREITARNLSIIMVGIFIFIIVIPIYRPSSLGYIKDVLPCVTTLLGASFGFYFSEKRLD